MPLWLALLAVAGVVVTLWMMVSGVQALWLGKLRLVKDGRKVTGPLAQFCGLLLLAALPLSGITCGDAGYLLHMQPNPEPARRKVAECWDTEPPPADDVTADKRTSECRQAHKEMLTAWVCDFAVFGLPLIAVVFALVDLMGQRSQRRRRKPSDGSEL